MIKYNYKQTIKTQHLPHYSNLQPYNMSLNNHTQQSSLFQFYQAQKISQNNIQQEQSPIANNDNCIKYKHNDSQVEAEILKSKNNGKSKLDDIYGHSKNDELRIDVQNHDMKIDTSKDLLIRTLNNPQGGAFLSNTSNINPQKINKQSTVIYKILSNSKEDQDRFVNEKCFINDKMKPKIHSKAIKREISLISAVNIRLMNNKQKLKPIYKTESEISQKKQKTMAIIHDRMRNKFISLKNQRIIRQVFKINQKNNNSIRYRIGNALEQKYYRLQNQEGYQNMFKIQSIEPEVNYMEKTSVNFNQHKKYRRNKAKKVQQIIQNSQEDNKIVVKNDISLRQQIKKCPIDYKNQKKLLLQNENQNKKFKLKALQRKSRKFIVPFETYYYRDFLWKLNYSNSMLVEPPLQYQHRLKVFIGKGNNSSLVRGLISRRYWLATAQKPEDANFLWTQLKQFNYFKLQKESRQVNIKPSKNNAYSSKNYLNNDDIVQYQSYLDNNLKAQEYSDERLLPRQKAFDFDTIIKPQSIKNGKMHNHFKNNYVIANKKALYKTLTSYYISKELDPFNVIPITFHIKSGIQDQKFLQFQKYYHYRKRQIHRNKEVNNNLWIIKPGQNSNRGFGIKLCLTLQQIKNIIKLKQKWFDGTDKTYIIQSYIQNPLLYHRRKFDFRHYILITCINGYLKGYWYEQGYVRTSSSQFNMKSNDSSIHLTNDAIQKYLANYGKYQKGNKLSYQQINQYICKKYKKKSFYKDIYPNMKNIAIDIMKASAAYLDPEKLTNNFQLFGLDFMVDANLKVWLIEVNSNPCLQLSCPILSMIIPNLIENVLEMTLDVMYPPAVRYSAKIPRYTSKIQQYNKFQLIFDERIQSTQMNYLSGDILDINLLKEEDDFFEDDGSQWDENI